MFAGVNHKVVKFVNHKVVFTKNNISLNFSRNLKKILMSNQE